MKVLNYRKFNSKNVLGAVTCEIADKDSGTRFYVNVKIAKSKEDGSHYVWWPSNTYNEKTYLETRPEKDKKAEVDKQIIKAFFALQKQKDAGDDDLPF